jgi:putative ABC transport system permease protein
VVNTLTLSIHERPRELGMLRAIGTEPAPGAADDPLRGAITALIGAVLGPVLGTFFAWIVTQAAGRRGLPLRVPGADRCLSCWCSPPPPACLAAILPARRASRLDILRSLAYE